MGIELRNNPLGRGTEIYKNGIKKGTMTPDNKICDIFGRQIGSYLGQNQAKDNYGFVKEIGELFKFL